MSDRVVLVYDVGTQSSRALLINQRGEILAKSQVKHLIPYESPYPGWAEKDADFYYENICQASRELKTRYPELFARRPHGCTVLLVLAFLPAVVLEKRWKRAYTA